VRSAATDVSSDVEALEAPSFSTFLREARDVLEGRASEVADEAAIAGEDDPELSARSSPPSSTSALQPRGRVSARVASELRATEAFALQRLRLAHVVLAAGFPGDAVRAAYEAVAASLRARLEETIEDGHAALIAAVYGELLPSGAIPSTLPGALARIHDLCSLEEQGLSVDPDIAASAVEDARAWLERDDAFAVTANRA
jgi:hypothetical protein